VPKLSNVTLVTNSLIFKIKESSISKMISNN